MFEYYVSYYQRCSNDYWEVQEFYMTQKEIKHFLQEITADDITNVVIDYDDYRTVENLA